MSDFLSILDETNRRLPELTHDDFRPLILRFRDLVNTLGLIGGLGLDIRNLVFMWPAMVRDLGYQYIDEEDEALRNETAAALQNVHSAFVVTLPSFIGDDDFDADAMIGILDDAYEQGKHALLDTSRL